MNNGNCAEIAASNGVVAVRDSKDADGPVLRYPLTSWASFLVTARDGGFDSLQ
jgi:Domain of unknown function (DUF397)